MLCAGRLWDEAKNLARSTAWRRSCRGRSTPPARRSNRPGCAAAGRGTCETLGRLAPAELASWLSRAAIFAHPARYEPFGLSVLEAALAGCALVLGDIASLREIWDGAAVFVDPGDDAAIAEAIRELCEDSRQA